ncbi:hypothetical protein [Larsenimonas rhizosphaerae]|uniref:Lipoprotein n=1 Tax=Larsenimonas rhizosphaerae TaxID=2944682 RepID=A0AA41ZKY5_9GAMM|nr:hypothetical protein [Larsenimonas rhizosphaerae]MCM2129946.1 hypothetical protein [Larsenimonas rhizosphaerae]MCX2522645.1 hypothetical protein [Larsenimonas rhizosphaerae]
MKRTLVALGAAALTLTLAGCDKSPGKDEVTQAMNNTLSRQIEQLKGIAQQMGDGGERLKDLTYDVQIDDVKDCGHPAPKKDAKKGDTPTDDESIWSCHVTGKVVVDGKAQAIDDDVVLYKNDKDEWLAR